MEYRVLPEKLVTAADLLLLEDGEWLTELEQGRLVREPLPGGEHGRLVMEIAVRLSVHVRERELGVVVAQSGFHIASKPDTVRGPDVAFVRAERIPAMGVPEGFFDFAPDLAVEVISPSNTAREVMRKVLEYLTAGSSVVWVVDPSSRTVTVYPGREHIRILDEKDELHGSPVLPDFRVPVSELFA